MIKRVKRTAICFMMFLFIGGAMTACAGEASVMSDGEADDFRDDFSTDAGEAFAMSDGEAAVLPENYPGRALARIQAAVAEEYILEYEEAPFYEDCLQNVNQGNSMVYADGYYYFRSQTLDYSLCRSKGMGEPVEVLADRIPGAIYVREDKVYFINVSDNRTLYRVGTDGTNLEKIGDFPMQELVVVEDTIYFRSVYDREYDPFYQLVEEPAEDDRYLYSMKPDGSGRQLLVPRVCDLFSMDETALYYSVYEEGKSVFYRCNLDGTGEQRLPEPGRYVWDLQVYEGCLYWISRNTADEYCLFRSDTQGNEEVLASNVSYFILSKGWIYLVREDAVYRMNPRTRTERLWAQREQNEENEDHYSWDAWTRNRGVFLVNGQLLARYFESGEKGVLWHIWDVQTGSFRVFEDMEPLRAEELVVDSSLSSGGDIYYPGKGNEEAQEYLAGEFTDEAYYGMRESGYTYGNFSFALPRFGSDIAGYREINRVMEGLMELAMEDKEEFFAEIGEYENPREACGTWHLKHGYHYVYVGERYLTVLYYRNSYVGGMRAWEEALPLVFDRETGERLSMEELFVEGSNYMKRLTSAIYKYSEMIQDDYWNDAFDNNVLVKNFGELSSYLTPDGIVLCYARYAIMMGAAGNPTYEIPYAWFEDIFRK